MQFIFIFLLQQLKATIRDLDNIRHQIQDEDVEEFDKQIAPTKVEVKNAIEEFCSIDAQYSPQIDQPRHDNTSEYNIIILTGYGSFPGKYQSLSR